jgi:four helix bundle protein
MKARTFRDLQVWQRSMSLARDIYQLTSQFPRSETFGLVAQMRRSAVSIPSNIAEGHGRLTIKNFAQFLGQARGSLNELETQIELAMQLGMAQSDQYAEFLREISELGRMLNALLTSMRYPPAKNS